MVVGDAVADALRSSGVECVNIFVASCAERMVQLFSGLRGDDPTRGDDVDFLLRLQKDLWDQELAPQRLNSSVNKLDGFEELQPADEEEELVDSADIFSFYAVLVVRYAVMCRATGDREYAMRCAHVCLTAMDQVDVADASFMTEEHRRQEHVVALFAQKVVDLEQVSRLRARDQEIGRNRLIAVRDQLPDLGF